MATPPDQVHEMQGLYGPFTIAERVVQKIWLRRDFAGDGASLADGGKLEIRSPGTWNLLGGPDFRGARLVINGVAVTGDIEVHFHVSDWRAHGHESDPAYRNVVLHVVMFPPAAGEKMARRGDGRELSALVLLPLLNRSLEEYASDDALENITERDTIEQVAELLTVPARELRCRLQARAESRWALKKHYATQRITKLGWSAAAHQTVLEILGYRRNRAMMLALAIRHPLAEWAGGLDVDKIYSEMAGQWELQGVRPANHPRLRLRQYQRWVSNQPEWPELLRQRVLGPNLLPHGVLPCFIEGCQTTVEFTPTTGMFRKQAGLPGIRERIARDLLSDSIGGSRLDTLVCDGFMPLLAAATSSELSRVWFHWPMGDVPGEIRRSLKHLGVSGLGAFPHCHGWAQGLLGWLVEREARASR